MRAGLRLLALGVALAVPALAQPAGGLRATVTQIAGDDAYLDIGRDAGLADGDTLRVRRDGVALGRLVVVAAASATAVVTYADVSFPLTRGDRLEIDVVRRAPEPPPDTVPALPAEPGRTSILDAPPERARAASPLRLSGRVQIGADALSSTTTFQETSTERTFSTPFASVRAALDGSRWRAELDVDARTRLGDGAALAGATDVRIYQAAVRTTVRGATLRAGRFVPERERFSGAWDGLDVRLGGTRRGLGVVGGVRPERIAGAPTARPGGFAYAYLDRPGDVRLSSSASIGALVDGGVLPFAGAAVRATATPGGRPVSLAVDALADRPADGEPGLARLGARASVRPVGPLTLRAGARSYRPSALDGLPDGFVGTTSRNLSVGATARRGALSVRADVSRRTSDALDPTRVLSGGVAVTRVPRLPLGLDAAATLWRRDDRTLRYLSAGASGTVRGARWTLGWHRSESPAGDVLLVSQGVRGGAYVPLTERLALRLRASLDGGGGLQRSRLYSALWVRL